MTIKMKKITIKQYAMFTIAALALVLTSCKKDFDKINDSPNSPKDVPTSYLLTGAQKGIMDNTWDRWWNGSVGMLLAQYYAENLYTDESQYQFRTSITNSYWTLFYSGGLNDPGADVGGLEELQKIIDLCNEEPAKYSVYGDVNNQKAVATALQVWMFQNITDTWGDVPFSEALQNVKIPQPKYDKQRDIYLGLLSKLDSAAIWLDETKTAPQGDVVYNGDLALWRKFINSLKLRVAIRMADKENAIAKKAIEDAVAAGVFTSNADNAVFIYTSSSPNVNPLYYDRYQSGRKDFCATKLMVDLLSGLTDDRLMVYYDTVKTGGGYTGRPYGQNSSNAGTMPISTISQPGAATVKDPTAPGIYLDYAQVQFILAEAAERGYSVGGTAEDFYKAGIDASFEFWTGAPSPAGYLAQATVDYTTLKGAGKTWKQIIGQQKWIALYMQGIQGWTEWRRLDFGLLDVPVDGTLEGSGIPLRMKYPVNEQTLNGKNYNDAVSNQGPDNQDTKVWWDAF
jgi:hypothetical protein